MALRVTGLRVQPTSTVGGGRFPGVTHMFPACYGYPGRGFAIGLAEAVSDAQEPSGAAR